MITSLIHERARSLRALGYNTTIRWVPAHSGVLGNEQADCTANEAARISLVKEKWTSLTYLKYRIRKDPDKENSDTINTYLRFRMRKGGAEHLLRKDKEINYYISKSKKTLTARFIQLKSDFKAIEYFFYKIKVINSLECW